MTRKEFALALKVYASIRDLQKLGISERKAILMTKGMIVQDKKTP